MRIDLQAVRPVKQEYVWEMQAALYGAHAVGYANVLGVVPPAVMEEWTKVESFDTKRAVIDAPCSYCWRQLELRRLMIGEFEKFGIFWIGQCECGTIHYALPDGPVDLTLE